MQSLQASGGDSSSLINSNIGSTGPPCRCGKPTKLFKSWTEQNPGRRFFRCSSHGFSSWFDLEEPHGWQKISLLEARDEIHRQRIEIKKLQSEIGVLKDQSTTSQTASANNFDITEARVEQTVEDQPLVGDSFQSRETVRMLQQVLVISWGGFIAATAIIILLSKN